MRVRSGLVVCLLACTAAFAGGPLLVDSNGVSQAWADGQVRYYTDRGNLSLLLPAAQADQFVADAWSRWTSVPLAALTVTRAGQLDEDVTGANFAIVNDVRSNSPKPVAIVYDADGSVVDALLGVGAGASSLCSTNAVLEQNDDFTGDGHIAHALVVINGNCAKKSTDLPILRYQLVRALGRLLGLDYSQLNENVVTGSPAPTGDDYAGYPVMHPLGVLCNALSRCIPNADVPRMDDRAALAKLYPSASFATATARVYGVVRFPDWRGQTGQGMQGVNVVARLVDPASGRVSHQSSASSVSGFLFRGNAGNPMTGYTNISGQRWDAHGSSDLSLEGFYDLAGLEIPSGYNSATYELSVEPLNPLYNGSTAVGPYVAGQVASAGAPASIRIKIGRGAKVARDFVMTGAFAESADRWEPSNYARPRAVPLAGSWAASLSGYGDRDYYSLQAQANRTFTFDVTALDENGAPTVNKALPVLGAWMPGDAEDVPRLSENFFNTAPTATTRLQGIVSATGSYILGVADYRGDGRPDFRYAARLFYGDTLSPARVGVGGGSVVTIAGLGFTGNTQVSVNGTRVAAALAAANQIVFRAPALGDGTYNVQLSDPVTGATSEMENALVVGSAGAKLVLLNGANPQVPVGTAAPNAISVQVVDLASGFSVAGATVLFAVPTGVAIVGCIQSSCPVITDQDGLASVRVQVTHAGASVITASLVTGGTVSATVNGLAATMEISVDPQTVYIGSGATLTIPVSALVVANGSAASGKTVDFLKNYGTVTITPGTATSGSNGVAQSQIKVNTVTSDVNLSACVAPDNSLCRTVFIHPVPNANLRLQIVSGDAQEIAVAGTSAPVAVRVTDTSGNPVAAVAVTFSISIDRTLGTPVTTTSGEVVTTRNDQSVVFSSSTLTVISDLAGIATLPGLVTPPQPVLVKIRAQAGASELDLQMTSAWTNPTSTGSATSLSVDRVVSRPNRSGFANRLRTVRNH